MSDWRSVFRLAASLAGRPALEALRDELRSPRPRLCQGVTVLPLPAQGEGAPAAFRCLLAHLATGGRDATVGECDEAFARLCSSLSGRLDPLLALTAFWDEGDPRAVFAAVLAEAEAVLAQRTD